MDIRQEWMQDTSRLFDRIEDATHDAIARRRAGRLRLWFWCRVAELHLWLWLNGVRIRVR